MGFQASEPYLVDKIQPLKALGIDCVINMKKYCLVSSPNLMTGKQESLEASGGIWSQKPGIHHAEGIGYIW